MEEFLRERVSLRVARRGELVDALDHPAVLAWSSGRLVGVATYVVDGDDCEVLTLHAASRLTGTGTALLSAVQDIAREAGCARLWLVTTNDKETSSFYQRRGFRPLRGGPRRRLVLAGPTSPEQCPVSRPFSRLPSRVLTLHAARRTHRHRNRLLSAVQDIAREAGCARLWLVTTNDNVEALRFYQRRGFRLTALRPGAVDSSRESLKPEIPSSGFFGIPLRDELELELVITGPTSG